MSSKKIRGITIQLGADAAPLEKALKDAEKTSGSLNGELKQVNKLLKFDPGNTELLSQKQKILAESIKNTETKLDSLKKAQNDVEKMFESGDIGEKEYRKFKRTIEETEQSLKSYKTQMSRMQDEQDEMKAGTKQLNTLLEATGKSLDDFQDVLGTRLTSALKNGTANSDDLTIAINKIGKAALGTDTDLGKMRRALNQIDDGNINTVRVSLQALKSDSGETEEELNGIGKGIASGNLMEAADQIAGLGDKVIELGENALETSQNMEEAFTKVNARFGETGEAAQVNADLIKRVYESGLGDSMESVANAVILVRDNLKDLNETDMENIISQALILEDTYGVDMTESLRGVNGLMQHFGLEATDAMDLLIAGTQSGLDKTNELGDNLSEYSGKFAEAGYSAEEYFQLLQNGLEGGAYNLDKVNDAINEVTTKLADGSLEDSMSKFNEETWELEAGTGGWSQSVEDVFKQWQQGGATQKQVIDEIVKDIQNTENQQDKLNKSALAFGTMAEDGSMQFIEALTSVGDTYTDVEGKAAEFQENTTTSAQEMEAAVRKIEDAFAPIGEDIQKVLAPILEFIANLAEKFGELPEPVRNFIEALGGIVAAVAVITPIIATILAIIGAFAALEISILPIVGIVAGVAAAIAVAIVIFKNWGAITDWISEKWAVFKEWVAKTWEEISQKASETWDGIKDYFAGLWDSISGKASEIWEGITGSLENVWDWIKETAAEIFNPIAEFFSGIWDTISSVASETWNAIKQTLSDTWEWIKDTASAIFTPIANFFTNTWNGIKDTASNIWSSIKDTLGGIWDSIKDKATGAFSDLWDYIKDGFNDLRTTLGRITKKIAQGIVDPIGGAVNGVIKGVNWILDKVGSDKQFALWDVPQFARGTGGLPRDTIGIVNDQKGPTYKELIVPPKGQPFIAEGRDVVLPMEKGTKIMPAKQTKSFLSMLPHFAGGIGEFFGNMWESIKDFTGSIWDYITHPEKIVQIAIDKFTDFTNVVEPWLSVAKGAVNTVLGGVVDFIKDIFDKELTVNYNPSAGVEQWRELAKKALQITGQYSETNLERLLYQMQTESGGNPNAINNWDSNAAAGIPSKGLMQVIDPTFRAYAMPGYDSNIYDPLSNMIASIRYAVARYGSLASAYQGTGYAEGIGTIDLSDLLPKLPTLDVRWFEDGGILTKPALFQMGNGKIGGAGESGAEAIAPIKKLREYVQDAVLEVVGDKDVNITINLSNVLDGAVIAKKTVRYTKPLIEEMDKFQKYLRGER